MNTIIEHVATRPFLAPDQPIGKPARRILVVEDNEAIRELDARVLVLAGYQVDSAEDGDEGWRLLNSGNFDLLITDHEMPRLSGLELVKQVRSAGMTLPIIMATGCLPEELERLPWLHLDATLLKPFTSDQLRRTVRRVLSSAGCATTSIQLDAISAVPQIQINAG